ncbi:MAG: hypothetical protein GKC10_06595 [Methanosarcinales archaeon]|nr:hypothetical protein [Methanosarcinales archaeon]
MRVSLRTDEIAYLSGTTATLALVKTRGQFFYLETDEEEIVLFTDEHDLMVASAFGTGETVLRGLWCTLFQVREMEMPLIVLPRGHPASRRLKVVLSIGGLTRLSCHIQPGTHPEQDVLCGPPELDGLVVKALPDGALVEGFQGRLTVEKF